MNEKLTENKDRKGVIVKIIWAWLIIGLICSCIVPWIIDNIKITNVYEQAQSLIDTGSYSEAADLLKTIEKSKYKDTLSLMQLCKAHMAYDSNYISSAHYFLLNNDFLYQTEEQKRKIDEFTNEVNMKNAEIERKEIEKQIEDNKNRVKNGVPFVGMSEGDIAKTSLGAPSSDIRHNQEVKNGNAYQANLYDYVQNNKVIFTVRCVRGQVTEVWDERNKPLPVYKTPSQKKKTQKDADYDDPYYAKDYADAEDFYDDNYDDFESYEDAEDYYNEYGED